MRGTGYGVVAVGTIAWFLPLIVQRRKPTAVQTVDPRARWSSPRYLLPVSLLMYVAGTEIRVHAEETLLAERFGEAFRAYRERVSAYVPLCN